MVEQKVKELHLDKSVLFLNERNDANRLYQGMDALIFPSLWEGLSVTLVEAQASSLPVFTSTNISPEHNLTDKIYFLELSKGVDYWVNFITKKLGNKAARVDENEQITNKGYNIEVQASLLQDYYIQVVLK
jgi:glycosyltransferase involved in cell wall biosynthesis